MDTPVAIDIRILAIDIAMDMDMDNKRLLDIKFFIYAKITASNR